MSCDTEPTVEPREGLLEVRRIGRSGYEEAHRLQQIFLEKRIANQISDVLILTEHERVITLGRGSGQEQGSAGSIPVIQTERGGEATYHGPGQLVAYPIIKLPEERRDLHRYLRDLEEVVIRVLAEFEVEGRRQTGLTGVWVGDNKICSIGVAVRRWVTWHGLALNLNTDLGDFSGFRPCGLEPQVMTRLADHVDLAPAHLLAEVLVVKHLVEVFELELPPVPPAPPQTPTGEGGLPQLPILPS